jgi:UDP-N-acetylmuramate--alanine ligase
MVVEADESDGTFLRLPATIAVVTNIDPEHLDHYGDFDAVRRAFVNFVENIPFYGFACLCIDHPEVQAMIPKLSDRKIVTYGYSPQADVRGINLVASPEGISFDVLVADRGINPQGVGSPRLVRGMKLPMAGKHNVQNSLAAIAVGLEMGLDEDRMRDALLAFKGVKRRFTKTGETNGVSVVDDYGHHPVEIAAVMRAAREAYKGRVIAVVQPHRYTRLRDLFEEFSTCFNDADAVIVSDVYAAGEQPIPGVSRDSLVESLRAHGHRQVIALESPEALPGVIAGLASPGDLVVCVGAGSITNWANALPGDLAKLAPAATGARA